jgi:hypothetical protein
MDKNTTSDKKIFSNMWTYNSQNMLSKKANIRYIESYFFYHYEGHLISLTFIWYFQLSIFNLAFYNIL